MIGHLLEAVFDALHLEVAVLPNEGAHSLSILPRNSISAERSSQFMNGCEFLLCRDG